MGLAGRGVVSMYPGPGVLEYWSSGVPEEQKIQITNPKYQTNNNNQNSKPVLVIKYWNLRFVCYLVLGFWDFIDSNTPILHHSFNNSLKYEAGVVARRASGSIWG